MSDKMRIAEIKKSFKDKPFTSAELYNFYLQKEFDLKKTTFRWRIHNLKNDGIIYSPKRGLYVTEHKKDFTPLVDKTLYNLYKKIKNQFPYSDMCIWETKWLNNYMIHQSISNNIIVEIDKEAVVAVFAFLQESTENVYLNPKKHEIETYILPGQRNIIIRNLAIDSPVENKKDIIIPRIEKIIVDLFVDKDLYVTYQGGELKNIYAEFFYNFNINQSTLNRYATRRSAADRLIAFLKQETNINNDELYI